MPGIVIPECDEDSAYDKWRQKQLEKEMTPEEEFSVNPSSQKTKE